MEEYKYLIPEESNGAIITNVSLLRDVETRLRKVFDKYHCSEVLMPSFEYVDLYTKMDFGFDENKMFQYVNHEGKNVTLRLDYTVPLARLYANSNKEKKRYSYFGKVYRKESRHKGRSSEFYQSGVELMSNTGIDGDKECLQIILEALNQLGLKKPIIELGSAKFIKRLLELTDNHEEEILEILKYRNITSMIKFIESNNFSDDLNKLLKELPTLFGDINIIKEIRDKIKDEKLIQAVDELIDVYDSLGSNVNIVFDLGMVPSMNYYTGLMVKGYTNNSAREFLTGGRYDDILPKFDCKAGAIGFCFNMNLILEALESEEKEND